MSYTAQIMTLAQWVQGAAWRAELPHSCDSHAFVWITRGQGRCIVEGVRRGFGMHNALVIPAGTMFAIEVGKQAFGMVCLVPPGGTVLMPDTFQHLRVRDVHAQAELTSLFEVMQREQNGRRPFADEALNANASLITVWLRRAMIDHGERPPDSPAAERLVMAYCALVERDYRSGRTMGDYAQILGVTPTHLSRSCRKACGLTAAELLTQRTLHAARELLAETREPVRNIARHLGFSSAAYFSRFILHHTGHSPTDLRARETRAAQTRPAAKES
ncbi:helix-turn-helix transcriptional regulator [Roseovarius salinarum]|uniref:helix-turn-helix transcriptional regulator n=1 Tax=Roseovarius salinarum TaxID=1981892 RepID=UPI000C31C18F|nr:AraC family transcriptional regulator [Roseovarius salinarum]